MTGCLASLGDQNVAHTLPRRACTLSGRNDSVSKVVREATWSAGDIVGRIRERVGHPATIRELMHALKIPGEDRHRFRRRITQLVEAGELIRIRGNRYGLADRMHLVVGHLQVNPRGFGFVTPEHAADDAGGDIFVAGVNLHQAMHGDRVAIRLERTGGRQEGRIVRVLERANHDLIGRYDVDDTGGGFVLPFDQRVVMEIRIPAGATGGARSGQMVVAEIERWPTPTRNPVGRIVDVIGALGDPGVDTAVVIRKHRLPDVHDPAAVAEAERLGDRLHLGQRVTKLNRTGDENSWEARTEQGVLQARRVVLALPVQAASQLLQAALPAVSRTLDQAGQREHGLYSRSVLHSVFYLLLKISNIFADLL